MGQSIKGIFKSITVTDNSIAFSKNNGKALLEIPFSQVTNFILVEATTFKYGYFTICTSDGKGYEVTRGKAASDENSITFNSSRNEQFKLLHSQLQNKVELKLFEDLVPKAEQVASDAASENKASGAVNSNQCIKICPNCGDKLLPAAQKCPTCGAKAKDFPLVDKADEQQIAATLSRVSHPKDTLTPRWEKNLEAKEAVWASAKTPTKRAAAKARIKENKANAVACCPKCGSTSLSANKKGFGIGKALLGASATMVVPPLGPLGVVAGNIGAKKVIITCLNCGYQWKP